MTAVYAKVDRQALSRLALPWPGASHEPARSSGDDYLALRRGLGFKLEMHGRVLPSSSRSSSSATRR